ncbi:MAG: hypothetical protein E7381_01365 [Clostridiales bacterium]|nr:hypothetical protein [Clostridiales bacterium]
MSVTENLQKALAQDLTDYRAIPFWSWNNELDEVELVRQIDEMYEAGMGGFIMHARLGLTTEYLGEKWFSCISACLKRAKELGMNAWVYDENGWPSGFVGGKLLGNESYRAQFLEYKITEKFDESAFAVFMQSEKEGYVRVGAPIDGVKEYHCIYVRTSSSNTDILNPEVVDAFIKETHEKYYERFSESFGKELAGFFTDEPQYYRWATMYSRTLAKTYEEKYGKDIRDGLIWLFLHDERGYKFRLRYYTIANDLYVENFYKKLYDWCEEHNCQFTGHSIEETCLTGHMFGGADCTSTYEYEHIPGIDALSRDYNMDLASKQVGSVASQLGIKHILTETFGCSGNDVTPRELKSLAELQYFHGVNLMCHHLFPYSMAGQGKHDHPPVFSKHNNWWKGFREFNDYFTKLGYTVANTDEKYDVLIIHPIRSVYFDWVRDEERNSIKELEESFEGTLSYLRKNGILYQFADERILARHGKVENGRLFVGKNEYNTVLVPKMKNISGTTLELLKAFTGKLLVEKTPEWVDGAKAECPLVSNTTMEEIKKNAHLQFYCEEGLAAITARSSDLGDFLFIKNYSIDDPAKIKLQGVAEKYKALDLQNFELENITNDYILPPCGSMVLIKDASATPYQKEEQTQEITNAFTVTDVTDNYLVCDFCAISYDGENFSEKAYIHKHVDDLLRADYKGKLYVKHTFNVREKMPLKLIVEKNRFISFTVNNHAITLGKNDFDFNFREADITQFIQEGDNEFVYCVDYFQHDGVHLALFDPHATESLRNCLYYDTHIENAYIKGAFTVNDDLSLSPRTALPTVTTDNYKNGYPFFKGTITLNGEYEYDGKGERSLSLIGRYQMAEITINGKTKNMTLTEKTDVTEYLKTGKNDIRIVVYSSLRNLFGPHHCKRGERAVGPWAFTMRTRWKDGTPDIFEEKHISVPFGVDKILIMK